ncbi:MAG: ATP-grasp domain-containing protein [Deltaproteobacteria bacterium]|nr:ATP-grasp domain-containing protein [Deltaproteobacteria bacterium]
MAELHAGNVLLLGARRRVFLAERLRERMPEFGGGRVVGADTDRLDPLRFFVDDFFLVPSADEPDYIECLLERAREYEFRGIIPWNDHDIRVLDANRVRLEDAGLHLLLPPGDDVAMFLDKRRTARWAVAHGIPHPRVFEDSADACAPFYAKPRFGQGSYGVERVEDLARLSAEPCWQDPEQFILQAAFEGEEYTVDVGLGGAGAPLFIVPRRRLKVRGGEVVIARVELDPLVVEFVARLCERLDFHGVFNVQVLRRGDQIVLLEFNPRLGGGTDLSIAAGADIPRYLLELLSIGRLCSPPPAIRDRVTMTRYLAPVFFGPDDS